MKKNFLTSFLLTLSLLVSCVSLSFLTVYAADIVLTDETVSVSGAPENSSLIVAAYDSDNALLGCKIYNGADSVNYTEDLKETLTGAARIKAFLWNIENLEPLAIAQALTVTTIPTLIPTSAPTPSPTSAPISTPTPTPVPTLTPTPTPAPNKVKTLVAYFSATNNTEGIAKHIVDATGADDYEILAAVPYTEDDLKYYTDCRADKEQSDPNARPEISGSVTNMEDYDIIFLGYPIWHGQAPKIIYTFLESYDFGGKTIVPFCTSASSSVGSSATNLHSLCSDTVTWTTGIRFAMGTSKSTFVSWINGLGLDIEAE